MLKAFRSFVSRECKYKDSSRTNLCILLTLIQINVALDRLSQVTHDYNTFEDLAQNLLRLLVDAGHTFRRFYSDRNLLSRCDSLDIDWNFEGLKALQGFFYRARWSNPTCWSPACSIL